MLGSAFKLERLWGLGRRDADISSCPMTVSVCDDSGSVGYKHGSYRDLC